MIFNTPCFVRVEDAEARDELIAWCASIGYGTNKWRLPPNVCYVFANRDFAGFSGELARSSLHADAIDCGTNIEMFKALAAMNNKNDQEQWFVCKIAPWVKLEFGESLDMLVDPEDPTDFFYRKATCYEIIEHFKNRES